MAIHDGIGGECAGMADKGNAPRRIGLHSIGLHSIGMKP